MFAVGLALEDELVARVKVPLQAGVPEELERFFLLRARHGKQYAKLSKGDVEWLDTAEPQFGSSRIERL